LALPVARCVAEGLVSGQRFAADASLIEADANKQNSTAKEDWHPGAINPADAPRAVREYLEVLDDAAFGAAMAEYRRQVIEMFVQLFMLLPTHC
jgi:hypothetical protein